MHISNFDSGGGRQRAKTAHPGGDHSLYIVLHSLRSPPVMVGFMAA